MRKPQNCSQQRSNRQTAAAVTAQADRCCTHGVVVLAPGDGVKVVGVEAAVARHAAAAGVVAAAAAVDPEVLALHAALGHVHADRVLCDSETC